MIIEIDFAWAWNLIAILYFPCAHTTLLEAVSCLGPEFHCASCTPIVAHGYVFGWICEQKTHLLGLWLVCLELVYTSSFILEPPDYSILFKTYICLKPNLRSFVHKVCLKLTFKTGNGKLNDQEKIEIYHVLVCSLSQLNPELKHVLFSVLQLYSLFFWKEAGR